MRLLSTEPRVRCNRRGLMDITLALCFWTTDWGSETGLKASSWLSLRLMSSGMLCRTVICSGIGGTGGTGAKGVGGGRFWMGRCGVDSRRGRGPCRTRGRVQVLRGFGRELDGFSAPRILIGSEGMTKEGRPSASQSNERARLRQTVGSRFAARMTEVVNQSVKRMSMKQASEEGRGGRDGHSEQTQSGLLT